MNIFMCILSAFIAIGYMFLQKYDNNHVAKAAGLMWAFSSGAWFCKWIMELATKFA